MHGLTAEQLARLLPPIANFYKVRRTMTKRITVLSFLALVFGMLVACASSGQLKMMQPPTEQIDHNAVTVLTVIPGEGLQPDEDLREVILRLRGQLFGRLVSDGIFRQVVHEGERAKYYVRVRVNTAEQVSMAARIMFGVLAGANELDVRVEVFEESSEISIMAFTVSGESASHILSGESEMEDAIREVVDKIILGLLRAKDTLSG